jgi:hypothetical protein
MKVPYLTDRISRTLAKRLHSSNRAIAIKRFGIILFELPRTAVTIRFFRLKGIAI